MKNALFFIYFLWGFQGLETMHMEIIFIMQASYGSLLKIWNSPVPSEDMQTPTLLQRWCQFHDIWLFPNEGYADDPQPPNSFAPILMEDEQIFFTIE